MAWEDEIRKERPRYEGKKSKFWGNTNYVPNELDTISEIISEMGEEERSNPEVQKDIKYIKELVAKQTKLLQKYLKMVSE